MEELTIEELFEWAQGPLQVCAGQPIIAQHKFEGFALSLQNYPEVKLDAVALEAYFTEKAKKYTACGANNNERFGVLRKNPDAGWSKIIADITT